MASSNSGTDLIDRTAGLVIPGSIHVPPAADQTRSRQLIHTAQLLYTFWHTGDPSYLDRAISPEFRDNTLPPGRPQGPAGPRVASVGFRTAVPDLTCELADLYITGDTVTARLIFRGHFTGHMNGTAGQGQSIEFPAIDIQHAGPDGRIIEDWHLEDNLTFAQQAGLNAGG